LRSVCNSPSNNFTLDVAASNAAVAACSV
jgi:hypothetical protein